MYPGHVHRAARLGQERPADRATVSRPDSLSRKHRFPRCGQGIDQGRGLRLALGRVHPRGAQEALTAVRGEYHPRPALLQQLGADLVVKAIDMCKKAHVADYTIGTEGE